MFLKTVKRFFGRIIIGRHSIKRQRSPSSFHDCIDKTERSRDKWVTITLVLLLLATICYMIYYRRNDDADIEPFDESAFANEQNEVTDPVTGNVILIHKKFAENNTPSVVASKTDRPKRMFYVPRDGLPMCASVTVYGDNNETNSSTVPKFPKTVESIDSSTALDMGIMFGGHYIPKSCNPRHKVAILVPFRNRHKNLNIFLYYMHPFLIRQNLEYKIFVIEQYGNSLFNKGRLFNAGFLEIQKNDEWQCVIFHDLDLLPADDRIRYTCPVLPRHMCARVVGKEHISKYNTLFSGVTAMTMWHVKKANGFSNMYKEKGESVDMFKRIQAAGLGVTRYKKNVGKYFSQKHPFRPENHRARDLLLSSAVARYQKDGLNSLRYSIVSYSSRALYTHIVVDVNVRKLLDFITESSVTLSP